MAIVVDCAFCDGTGKDPFYEDLPCRVCKGRGELILSYDNPVECRYCDGDGEDPHYEDSPCQNCQGIGVVPPVIAG